MFKKILIANRGEIACRVIKTARRMGIDHLSRSIPMPTRARLSCAWRTRRCISAPAAGGGKLSENRRQDHRCLQADRRGGRASRLWLPVRTRELRRRRWPRKGSPSSARRPTRLRRWATRSNRKKLAKRSGRQCRPGLRRRNPRHRTRGRDFERHWPIR